MIINELIAKSPLKLSVQTLPPTASHCSIKLAHSPNLHQITKSLLGKLTVSQVAQLVADLNISEFAGAARRKTVDAKSVRALDLCCPEHEELLRALGLLVNINRNVLLLPINNQVDVEPLVRFGFLNHGFDVKLYVIEKA